MQELLDFEQEKHADRVFLGWDQPLLESLRDWLLADENRHDLASTLVVVPTSNSGRRLRILLSGDGGVISPHVVVPSRLFEVEGVASKQESLWAWVQVIRGIDLSEFPHLFRNHDSNSKAGFHVSLMLAKQLIQLRHTLSDANASFRDAGYHSPEKERWAELGELESKMIKQLGAWKLRDPVIVKREQVLSPSLPAGITRVVVACVPDPTPMAIRALQALIKKDIPVTVLIHAPESERDGFDPWGVPRIDAWSRRDIHFPQWQERLHLVDRASDAAEACVRILAEQETSAQDTALALCDPTFEAALEKTFSENAWPLYNPEGRSLAASGLVCLLRAMGDLLTKDHPFEALRELVRLPGAELFLPAHISRHEAARQMDQLHSLHLPETLSDARYLASSKQREIIQSVATCIDELKPAKMVKVLRQWLSHWLTTTDDNIAKVAEKELVEALDAITRLEKHDEHIAADEAFEMLAESLKSARVPSEHGESVLDLQGWLEISYDPARHLVLAGMHEECVPDGTADDVFLPDSLRDALGLRNMQARFARDAFILHAALSSRAEHGRVDAIVARFNDAGEARKPSRLLMCETGQELAARVCHLFNESSSDTPNRGAWERDWELTLPRMDNIYAGESPTPISPSAIKDYLDCPLRFFLKRIVKMRTYDAAKREMDALDFGKLCHHVLERFGVDEAIRDSSDRADIEQYCMEQLDATILRHYGKNLSLPLMVQLESARERLRAFAAMQAADRAMGWCILHTEYEIGDKGGSWQLAGHPVKMAIDRIDRHEDGKQWRVWDYKTSGKAKNPTTAHLRSWKDEENRPQLGDFWMVSGKPYGWAEVQLPMYAAFTQQHFDTGELPQVGYINLPRAVSEVAFEAWSGFDQSVLEHAMSWAGAAVQKIRDGEFLQAAHYPAIARDWDDFNELAPDGLASTFGLPGA